MVTDATLRDISEGPLLDQVLDATWPVWGESLTRQAYGAWNRAQGLTIWGRQHLARVGLVRDEEVLVSAKRYLFDASSDGRPLKVLGIGAVFTPEHGRGQGLAPALIEAMIDDARSCGCEAALLFSEIGAEYYARRGFQEVTRTLLTIDVPRNRLGAPATLVRAGEASDLPLLADMSVQYAGGAGFALQRTAALIEFGLVRRRVLAGLGPAGLRTLEFFVSEEGHRAVAYVVISRGPGGAFLEECGDRDPSGARVGALLEVLAAREPSETDRTLRAWWPEDFRPPQIRVVHSAPAPEVMMVRALGQKPVNCARAVYWSSDVF